MSGNWLKWIGSKVSVIGILALLPALLFATPANAERAAERSLEEMVVTATRIETKNFDLSAPVEVVTPQNLEIDNPVTTAQSLEKLPGVSISKAGVWELAPVIRGLGGNRVLVLIDGDRENNLWAGRAPLTPFIDVGEVERIEVVKGPGSLLYGTDALGGVINIITKVPDFAKNEQWTFLNSVESRYSSVDNGWFGRYYLQGGGYGFDFGIALSGRNTDDYRDGGGDKIDNSQYEATNIDLKGRYFFNDNHELNFSIKTGNIDDMGVPQKSGAEYSHFTKFDTDTYKIAYHGRKLGWLDDLQWRTWYVDQKREYQGKFFSSSKPVYTEKVNNIDSSVLGTTVQARVDFSASHSLIGGVEYAYETCDGDEEHNKKKNANNKTFKLVTFKPVPDAERNHAGIFMQDELSFGDAVTLWTGLRYDYFSADADDVTFTTYIYDKTGQNIIKTKKSTSYFGDKTDGALTFKLGLLYAVNDNIHLTTNFSSGFRAPDIFELYSTRGGSYILLGDPDLDPEYAYNLDLGFKFDYDRFRVSCSGFYNQVQDYIDLVYRGASFAGLKAYEYVNVSDAELYGADASFEFDLLQKLTLFGNIAYVKGRERHSHDRLNKIPPLNGLLGIRWQDELKNGVAYWFECNSQMYDAQNHPAEDEEETPGYSIFNLSSGIKFNYASLRDVTLSLNVENLFDKKYRSHLNYADFLSEPGFNVVSSLKISF